MVLKSVADFRCHPFFVAFLYVLHLHLLFLFPVKFSGRTSWTDSIFCYNGLYYNCLYENKAAENTIFLFNPFNDTKKRQEIDINLFMTFRIGADMCNI